MNKILVLALAAFLAGCAVSTTNMGAKLDYNACENGDAKACVAIADNLYDNDDIIGAEDYARKACDLKYELACKKLAYLTKNQPSQSEINNAIKLEKECKAGNSNSCITFANNLIFGRGVPKDPDRGGSMARDLCYKNNAKACMVTSSYYKEISKKNKYMLNNAANFAKKACDLNLQEGCNVYYKLKSQVVR